MPVFYGTEVSSRLLLGTAQYPSPAILAEAFRRSEAGIATVSIRREAGHSKAGQDFWSLIQELNVKILPNTAGCHSVGEAVTTAHMAHELFDTRWIKLEVIGQADGARECLCPLVEQTLLDTGDHRYLCRRCVRREAIYRCIRCSRMLCDECSRNDYDFGGMEDAGLRNERPRMEPIPSEYGAVRTSDFGHMASGLSHNQRLVSESVDSAGIKDRQ